MRQRAKAAERARGRNAAKTIRHVGVKITVTRSAGTDGAVVVFIDTDFEPNASDGGPGLRVLVNDADTYIGKPYAPTEDDDTVTA